MSNPIQFVPFILTTHLKVFNNILRLHLHWISINKIWYFEGILDGKTDLILFRWPRTIFTNLVLNRLSRSNILTHIDRWVTIKMNTVISYWIRLYWNTTLSNSSNIIKSWFKDRRLIYWSLRFFWLKFYVILVCAIESECGKIWLLIFVSCVTKADPFTYTFIYL